MRITFRVHKAAMLLAGALAVSDPVCSQESTRIPNPFRIDIDPMSRLLLVNIEKDPDSLYIGFEPQVIEDTLHGTRHLVIGWRIDGKVDVYHQPTFKPNPDGYDIVGKGLANMVERDMREAYFIVNEQGAQAHYVFDDLYGRDVRIRVNERNPKKRSPFGLLAPMGDAAEHPSAMPFILLEDFYFVRRKHTDISVTIDGIPHAIDKLPMPIDMTSMYFTRYSPKPLIARLNPAYRGAMEHIPIDRDSSRTSTGDYDVDIIWNNGSAFIHRITRKNDVFPVRMTFDDPFPDISSLRDGASFTGSFVLEGLPSTGHVAGDYTVQKAESRITIIMIPSKGWTPRPTKFSLRFLYTVAGVFKQWPATYRWTAIIHQNEDGDYWMESGWERINPTES